VSYVRDDRGRFAPGGGAPNKVRDLYVEEVEALIGSDTPEGIARRLGLKPASLARALERSGRGDLAAQFKPWAKRVEAGYVKPQYREDAA
jgi:hypothetical protein